MTYAYVVKRLGLKQVCLGGCGISDNVHRRGMIYLGVVHWGERGVWKRGLRRFLLLCAKRDRLASPDYLNTPGLFHLHLYLDEQRANDWALRLGVRFPIRYSLPERRTVSLVPNLSRRFPAVWAWAHRGTA